MTSQKRKKILIVEDDSDLSYIIVKSVEKAGYGSFLAVNGKEALKMAALQAPDLILMDMMMPLMDGFETTRLIRSDPQTASIPIIAVTAMSGAVDKKKCLESGCNDYLSKPFTPAQLAAHIEKVLKVV